jgi:sphingosine kinase
MTLDSIASRTGKTFPAMDGATTKTGQGGVLEARTSRISFDDVEKNKGGDEYVRRKVFVAGEVMRLQTTLEEDGIESSADEEEEEEEDEDEEFCVVRKRDIVSCELVVGSKIKKKNKTETKTTRQHRIVITSFPRKKRLIDYAVLPRFLSSSASAFTSRNAGDDFSAAAAKGNSGKRFGHKKNVHVVKYKSLDEALEDVKRIEEECGLEHQRMNKRGRFLVFINPAAGRGKAEEVFKKHVEPVLKCARNCVVEAIVTTRSGETEERTYERSKESLLLTRGRGYESNTTTHNEDARVLGIIAIGGDGTIAEAYAGVERAQKELGTHESIPIGAIPAGSGNAICVSLAEQSEEVNDATTMALLIAKGQTIRLDGARLAIYRNDENNNISNNRIAVYQNTALLSVSWGFFADVDLESERFRCLGGTRFIVQAIARLINLRTYKMDLTYRVSQETKSVCERLGKSLLGRKEGEFRTIKDENILGIWAMNLPWGSGDTKSAPLASPSDGFFDIIIVHPTSKLNLLKLLLDFDTKGSHAKNDAVTYLKTSEFELTLLGRSDLTEGVSGSTNASRSNAANPLGCVDGGEDPDAPSAPPDLYEGGRVMIDGEVVPDVCSREETFTVKGSVERGLANVFSFAPSSSSPQTYSSSSFHVVAAAAAGGSIA